MWDDVIIGTGDRQCSASRVIKIEGNHSISENSTSYWISHCILEIGMTIFKSSPEGQDLTALINSKTDAALIHEWINTTALQNIDVKVLKRKIRESQQEFFDEGRKDKARQILSALSV